MIYTMKNPHILILIGVILVIIIGLTFFGPYNAEAPQEVSILETNLSTSTDEISSEEVVETPGKEAYTSPTKTVTPPLVQQDEGNTVHENGDIEIEKGELINEVFANSKRCEWYDPETQNNYNALHKNEKVKLITKTKDNVSIYAVYNNLFVHVWEEDTDEGYLITYNNNATTPILPFRTRDDVVTEMYTHERSDCDDKTLNDSHFEIPNNVDFQIL